MALGDFIPAAAGAQQGAGGGKVYLITEATLKEILKVTTFAPSDFDVNETPKGPHVSLKNKPYPSDDNSTGATGVTADFALLDCLTSPIDTEADPASWVVNVLYRVVITNGIIISLNETYAQRAPLTGFTYRFIQSCCWVDDAP